MFNAEEFIDECILSIINQNYKNWELLIVNDNSIDNSQLYVKKYLSDSRIKIFNNISKISGPSICRNIGISKATGEYIIFLDSDDYLFKNALANRIHYIQQNPHLDFVVFQIVTKGLDNERLTTHSSNNYLNDFLSGQHRWVVSAPIWKKETIIKLNGFNEDLNQLEDPELHCRALLEDFSYEVLCSNEPDGVYRKFKEKSVSIQKLIAGYVTFIINNYNTIINRNELSNLLNAVLQGRKSAINSIFKFTYNINYKEKIRLIKYIKQLNLFFRNNNHISFLTDHLSIIFLSLFLAINFPKDSRIRWIAQKFNNKIL